MFNWFKSKFAYKFIPHETMSVTEYNHHVEKNEQKVVKEKAEATGLESLTKAQLLTHAKTKGIKVNASMKKSALITTIKSAE